jgi:hypothetical protein
MTHIVHVEEGRKSNYAIANAVTDQIKKNWFSSFRTEQMEREWALGI